MYYCCSLSRRKTGKWAQIIVVVILSLCQSVPLALLFTIFLNCLKLFLKQTQYSATKLVAPTLRRLLHILRILVLGSKEGLYFCGSHSERQFVGGMTALVSLLDPLPKHLNSVGLVHCGRRKQSLSARLRSSLHL